MRLGVGDQYAKCPYCGSVDFVPEEPGAPAPPELQCAECGGYASRKVLLERSGEDAIESRRLRRI
jgi:hypothetical protein